MANQYKNALYYAAQELAGDLKRWDIKVNSDARQIRHRGKVTEINFGTPLKECRRILKRMIAAEKKAYLDSKQEAMF